jgi:pimeloyl-ACP methyl ester carboxylesterase
MNSEGMISQRIDVGNRHLYFECAGQGEPVVILESGLGDGCDAWEPIWEKLTAVTKVCRYDRAGIGKSDPAQTPRTSNEVAADLHALISQLGLHGPFVIVAHSFGCLHARLFAHQYPDQVAAMVLLDSTLTDQGVKTVALLPPQMAQDSESLKELRANLIHPTITETVEGLDANACYEQVRLQQSFGNKPFVTIVSGSLVFNPSDSWWPPELPGELADDFTRIYLELT